jgi:hypothetical protein
MVKFIWGRLKTGTSPLAISKIFGVTKENIRAVIKRKIWKNDT